MTEDSKTSNEIANPMAERLMTAPFVSSRLRREAADEINRLQKLLTRTLGLVANPAPLLLPAPETPASSEAQDAARYRFLRQPGNAIVYARGPNVWGEGHSGHVKWDTPEALDAAVDAARSTQLQQETNTSLGQGADATTAVAEPARRPETLLSETGRPQAPIAKVTVRESGAGHYAPDDVSVSLYAPGLPPGEHDLYCEPTDRVPAVKAGEPQPDTDGYIAGHSD